MPDDTRIIARRAAGFTPQSVDEQNRTVELVASTGAGVQRIDIDGPFLETLALSNEAVDLSRIDGMPLLDSHRQDAVDRVLGVVGGARVADGKLVVIVKISERAEAIWKDIKAGILRNVSVGYEPLDFKDDISSGNRTRTITRWRLMEVSLVPIGADDGAKTRSSTMPEPTTQNPAQPEPATTTAPPAPTVTRAAVNAEIRALGETFDIETDVLNGLVDREATVEEARAAVLDSLKKKTTTGVPRVTLVTDHESPEVFVTRAGEALFTRAMPTHKVSEAVKPLVGMTMLDIAREILRMRSVSTTGLQPVDIVTRALHTTSDFPLIFGNTANRVLRQAYEAAPAVMKRMARQTTAKDFRAKTKVQLGEAPTLEKVNEHGEYKRGSFAEVAESYAIDTYGKVFGMTRKMIVNDDLGAFTDIIGKFGFAATEFEAQFLVNLLQSGSGNGPTMNDTKALFHTDHGNKAPSGAAPAEATLSAGRLAMRKQKGLSGKPINVPPRFLLVPPELETSSEKLLATIQPTKSDDVNPFGGKFELLVEARLSSSTRWYLGANPDTIEGLEYAYLQGEEGPQTETRAGFDVDGLEIKVREDFGAAFVDWRGWYLNPGA